YEEGMKIFPNAGNLYLERGNIYLDRGFHDEAIINYELGIKADPMFSSNYYRLALLSLNSDNKFSGLIYGEIFMNLERTSSRTIEMSKLLYDTYKNAITLKDNKVEVSFCKNIVIKVNANNIEESLKLPPCSIFEMYFVLNINQETEINLTT